MRRIVGVVATALLLVLGTLAPASAAAPDVWAKATISDVWIRSIQYVAPNLFLAGSETSGVFRASTPSGPWTDVSGNLPAGAKQVRQAVALSGQVYLATSGGLFSGDGSGSWQQLGAASGTPADQRLDQGGVQSVVFPTGQASTMVAATSGSGRDGVFRSTDGGAHWSRVAGLTDATVQLAGEAGAPVYAAAASGFYTSVDGGASWTLTSDGIPPGESPRRIAMAPDPEHLVAATNGGVYRSDDSGASWHDVSGTGDGALLASDVRGFELAPTQYWSGGQPVIIAGTDNGVWVSLDGGAGWARMATGKNVNDGVTMGNESVWSLEVAGSTLLAGTQGHGIFVLPLQGAEAPASIAAPSGNATQNTILTASPGAWAGTGPYVFRYQWKRCAQSSASDPNGTTCSNISGALDRTYQPTAADVGDYLRVGVRARTLTMASLTAEKLSASIGPIAAPPGPVPTPPTNYPKLLNATSAPWGATLTIDAGGNWKAGGGGGVTPTTFTYLWERCTLNLSSCDDLPETGSTYTTTAQDVDHLIRASVVGTIGTTSSDARSAGTSGAVYEQKPQPTDPPRVAGQTYVGAVLQSTAGAWTGHAPTFTRRWLRCNADGVQCNPTNPVVTTHGYTLSAADRGSTLRVEVTAAVVDQFQNRTTTVQSAPTAVITDPPPAAGGGGGGPAVPVVKLAKPKKVKPGAKLKGPQTVAGFTSIGYQWLRNGKPIKKATKATYKISRKDRGKKISLRLTLAGPSGTVTVVTNAVKVPKAKKKRR